MSTQVFFRPGGELGQFNVSADDHTIAIGLVKYELDRSRQRADGAILALLSSPPPKSNDNLDYILGAMTVPHYQ